MSIATCWAENCPHDLPICCFECDRQAYCEDICTLYDDCYEGGEDEE